MSIKIFSPSQIRAIDASTIENEPISSLALMERASSAFVAVFKQIISTESQVTVFAGCGNNGGDAFAVARLLSKKGYMVKVYLVRQYDTTLSNDCQENKNKWQNMSSANYMEINESKDIQRIDYGNVIIDGIFGVGLNRPLDGIYAEVVCAINVQRKPVYSIDIPSGLFADDNTQRNGGEVIKATKVFTFQIPKLAFMFPENEPFVQDFKVLDIGLNEEEIKKTETPFYLLQKEDVKQMLRTRSRFSHKGNYGHALLIAGQSGKMGAAVIAAKACLRAGVGLITVHCPKYGVGVLQTTVPEAMIDMDESAVENTDLGEISEKFTIGIGPGIGKGIKASSMLQDLLFKANHPIVADADALNIFAENRSLMPNIPHNSILTPHPIEFERMVKQQFTSGYERLQAARRFAMEWHVILVLKGAYTAVVMSDGHVFFNPTGNPGMATAGSGDCLTGILTSLLAQGYSPENTACVGVYLHGLAGDMAVERTGAMESVMACDIVDSIGSAYQQLRS